MPSFLQITRLLLVLLGLAPIASDAGLLNWGKGSTNAAAPATPLDNQTLAIGLQQVLDQAAASAVNMLGRPDGFRLNPRVAIGLPPDLDGVAQSLRRFGMGSDVNEFVADINKAAEAAVPDAKPILLAEIHALTIGNADVIVRGPDDAATAYFRAQSRADLVARLKPVVAQTINASGTTAAYRQLLRKASYFGSSASERSADLEDYVAQRMADGIFIMMADEEHRIRHDAAARTTPLLRQIFRRRL